MYDGFLSSNVSVTAINCKYHCCPECRGLMTIFLYFVCSLKSFVENSGDYANWIVDSLLNVLTGNEHSKASRLLQQVG